MSYRIEIRKKAAKALYKLPAKDREKLIVKIQALAETRTQEVQRTLSGVTVGESVSGATV